MFPAKPETKHEGFLCYPLHSNLLHLLTLQALKLQSTSQVQSRFLSSYITCFSCAYFCHFNLMFNSVLIQVSIQNLYTIAINLIFYNAYFVKNVCQGKQMLQLIQQVEFVLKMILGRQLQSQQAVLWHQIHPLFLQLLMLQRQSFQSVTQRNLLCYVLKVDYMKCLSFLFINKDQSVLIYHFV